MLLKIETNLCPSLHLATIPRGKLSSLLSKMDFTSNKPTTQTD
jgi:hypothetical protein